MKGRALVTAYMCAAFAIATANLAQTQGRDFTPVTDAMLQNPGPGRLVELAAHAEWMGVQPA